jgi:hypothetical protein
VRPRGLDIIKEGKGTKEAGKGERKIKVKMMEGVHYFFSLP